MRSLVFTCKDIIRTSSIFHSKSATINSQRWLHTSTRENLTPIPQRYWENPSSVRRYVQTLVTSNNNLELDESSLTPQETISKNQFTNSHSQRISTFQSVRDLHSILWIIFRIKSTDKVTDIS